MEIILEKADSFKRSIDAISALIDEAELVVTKKGLELKATDPSQVSMVDFSMPSEAFELVDSEETKLGLDLTYFSQVLSRVRAGDKLILKVEDSSLLVSFKGKAERSFKVPLIDISSSEVPQPKIDFDAELLISANHLQQAFKDASLISTHISLGADEKHFLVMAKSSKGNLNEKSPVDKEILPELKTKQDCKSMFQLDYLQSMLKSVDSSTNVELSLKNNAPVKIAYTIGQAKISYFLAPRVDN